MAIQIPFPLPAVGFALNSKMRINLDFLVAQFNEFNSGTATWDNVSIGTANSLTGTLTFYNASNANYLTFKAGATGANTTYTWPTALPGSTPGVLTATTAGVMSWKTSFDSWIVGTASSVTGTMVFYNASNANTLTLQAGATSPSTTFTLPTAAPVSTGILTSTSGGVMSFVSGTGIIYNGSSFSGSASVANALAKVSTAGVVTLADHQYNVTAASNGLLYIPSGVEVKALANALGVTAVVAIAASGTPAAYALTGTTNQIIITPSSGAFTFTTPQDIATTSSVVFSRVKVDAGTYDSPGFYFASSTSNTVGLFAEANGTGLNVRVGGAFDSTVFAIDNTGYAVATLELRAPTVRATTALKVSTGAGSIVTIQGLSSAFGAYTLTLPPNDGASGDVLRTDGTGILTWVSVSAAGGATVALDNLSAVAINTSLLPASDNAIDLGSTTKNFRSLHVATSIKNGSTTLATATELGYLTGVTSALQTQLDTKIDTAGTGLSKSGTTLAVSTVPVANGGTNAASFTAYSVICGGTTSTGTLQNVSGLGTSGQILVSNGAASLPSWQAVSAAGGATKALDNLASVAINTTLVSSTDNTHDLGTSAICWRDTYVKGYFKHGSTNAFSLRTTGNVVFEKQIGIGVVPTKQLDVRGAAGEINISNTKELNAVLSATCATPPCAAMSPVIRATFPARWNR